jgi:hypothetical protein
MPLLLTADANPGTASWSTASASHVIAAAGTSPDINGGTTVVVGTFAGLDGSPVQITPQGDWGAATNWWYAWDGSDQLSIVVDVDPAASLTFSYAVLQTL